MGISGMIALFNPPDQKNHHFAGPTMNLGEYTLGHLYKTPKMKFRCYAV
jgi:hypothetical protein